MPNQLSLTLLNVAEIRALLGDADQDLVHDCLEGQTDVYEIIDWLIGKLGDEDAFVDAIDARVEALASRKQSALGRMERLRDGLRACLNATGERSLRRPEATVTLSAKKTGIAGIDETQLPERFWKVKREVSRSAINEALAAGEVVPGVILSNGGEVLTVRRK